MLRRLYDWVMRLSGARHAGWALAAIAFAESSFFPIPPDVLLVPLVVARPERTWRYAAICAGCSVAGGVAGYAIGYFLAPLAHQLLEGSGLGGAEAWMHQQFSRFGVGVVLIMGVLPIPYKLVTIVWGLLHLPLWELMAASVITRGARFFGVAALVKRFGPAVLPIIEKRLTLFAALAVAAVAVVVAVKLAI